MNNDAFPNASEPLDCEVARAHSLRAGKLEGLVKGDLVYVDHFERWIVVRLIRRIPGDCWIAEVYRKVDGHSKVVVMAGNFGGKHYSW